jgi:uncharacterized protein YuzE
MDKLTQIFYDKEGDVLYLSVGKPRRAVSQELGDAVLLRIDTETDEIIGLTVMNLSTRFGSLETPQTLPVEIELHQAE